jgi:hypothetical protein
MQDEELDKLIHDAANQYHPPYNDKDWGDMAMLLDKHMPHQKDRRRYLLWLLLLLLVTGSGIALWQPWKNKATTTAMAEQLQGNPDLKSSSPNVSTNTIANNATPAQEKNTSTVKDIATYSASGAGSVADNGNTTSLKRSVGAVGKKTNASFVYTQQAVDADAVDKTKKIFTGKGKTKARIKSAAAGSDDDNSSTVADNLPKKQASLPATDNSNNTTINNKPEELTSKKEEAASKEDEQPATTATDKSKKSSNKKTPSNFAFTASTGVDISYISANNLGAAQPFYGLGITYNISKRLRIATGFYVSNKVYTALPDQYKITGTVNPNLTNIDANCKVYEIPVDLYYNFKTVKKHNWFTGAGISSYLMKKETYDYKYKTPAGNYYNYVKQFNNANRHYFSVLTLTGGYQYNISNRVAITAAPYVKIALGGVGQGKVKLGNSGIAVTGIVRPFNKKR